MKGKNLITFSFQQKQALCYVVAFITAVNIHGHIHGHLHIHVGATNPVGGNGAFAVPGSRKLHRKILPECKSENTKRDNKRAKLSAPPPPPPNQNGRSRPEVFFWMLLLQHPPAYCLSNPLSCTHNIPDDFKIHGLLPLHENRKAFSVPNKKMRERYVFGLGRFNDLQESMNSEWPQIGSGIAMDFWVREYTKHGYITGLSLYDYFSLALEIKAKVDVLTGGGIQYVLNEANLRKGSAYASTQFCEPVRQKLQAVPHLKCQNLHLLEVQVCLNRTLHFVDCSFNSSCSMFGCLENHIVYASIQ